MGTCYLWYVPISWNWPVTSLWDAGKWLQNALSWGMSTGSLLSNGKMLVFNLDFGVSLFAIFKMGGYPYRYPGKCYVVCDVIIRQHETAIMRQILEKSCSIWSCGTSAFARVIPGASAILKIANREKSWVRLVRLLIRFALAHEDVAIFIVLQIDSNIISFRLAVGSNRSASFPRHSQNIKQYVPIKQCQRRYCILKKYKCCKLKKADPRMGLYICAQNKFLLFMLS